MARNGRLVAICQHVRSVGTGGRVIEALASGIPTIAQELSNRDLPPAQFIDAYIKFTVLLRSAPVPADSKPAPNNTEMRIFDALGRGPRTVAEMQTALSLRAPNIRRALQNLRDRGLIHQEGGRGRRTTYRQAGAAIDM